VILPEVLSENLRTRSLPGVDTSLTTGRALKDIVQGAVDELERRLVDEALRECDWKKTDAARLLQVSRPTLDAKIKRHRITRSGE